MRRIFHDKFLACLFVTLLGAVGCGSSTSGPTGGSVAGAVDMHCTVNGLKKVQVTSMAACAAPSGNDGAAEDGHVHDPGTTDGGGRRAGDETGGEEMAEPLHLFEMCSDANRDSPHGHVGFLIAVP